MAISETWGNPIAQYMRYLTAIGRPATTVRLRRDQLRHLARSLNIAPGEVTYDDIVDWFAIQVWKPETRRSYRSGIRGFFAWAQENGIVETNPAVKLPQVRQAKPVPRPAPDHVWAKASITADLRVLLMLRLAAEAGLRRAEVATVHTRDLRSGPAGHQLQVHGKGNRERVVPITAELATLIAAGAAGHTPGASPNGWLFPGEDHGHLTAGWVGTLCSRVMPEVWSMHALRHRFASRAYRGTRNLRAVQGLLGHSSVAVTERYTAVDDDEMRAAMQAAVA
ncbi:MAG: tyrosine-type recombinase/integrase [Mycolicibacterium sp.]|nr:tyrosine-type recombinase/integrase [Mycolicibacterium sp.]